MRYSQRLTVISAIYCVSLGLGTGESAARAGDWSLPDSRLGIRTAPLLLLSRIDVQADLRLEPGQIAGVHAVINELTQRALALRGKSGPTVVAERRAIDEAQADWLAKNLTGNQVSRLRQIELQWEGAGAMLSRPTVAEYLRLTSEQRQILARAISERNTQRSRGKLTPSDEQVLLQRAHSVLSKTQQELWANLLGSPCRFALNAVPAKTRDEATQQAVHVQQR
jgi:hypothetical protein